LLHNFEAESGAKVSHIFETSKFSEDFFFKNFLKNLLLRLSYLRETRMQR